MAKSTPYKFKDEFYVKGYRLARAGLSLSKIAQTLGVSKPTLHNWIRTNPDFKKALRQGHHEANRPHQEYALDALPAVEQEVFKKLKAYWDLKGGPDVDNVERLLTRQGLIMRQRMFLFALLHCNYNASQACRFVNIRRNVFEVWCKDRKFKELVDEVTWHRNNFVEGALMQLVDRLEPSAVIFASKCLLRDRGYNEKQTVEVTGDVQHNHAHVHVDTLDLPLEVRQQILEAMRAKPLQTLTLNHES